MKQPIFGFSAFMLMTLLDLTWPYLWIHSNSVLL